MPLLRSWIGAAAVAAALVAAMARPLGAQFSESRFETPDAYTFVPKKAHTPLYVHDEAKSRLIVNPDFFCTACAKDGRIAAGSRDEMKDVLEFTRQYEKPVDGRMSETFGEFRLVQEKAEHVLRYLCGEMKPKNPVFIEDRIFRIFTDLPGTDFRADNPDAADEMENLREIFPELVKEAKNLDPHQRAHLYLFRAHRLLEEFAALVNDNPKEDLTWRRGPFFGMTQKYELYVFDTKKQHQRFLQNFTPMLDTLDGCWYRTLQDDSMVLTTFEPVAGRDCFLRSTFTHRFTGMLLTSYKGYIHDIPAFLVIGYAHLMERRLRTDFNTFTIGDGLVPEPYKAGSWKQAVRDAVSTGRYTKFPELLFKVRIGEVAMNDRPICWSLVSFLVQLDQKRFANLVQLVKNMPVGDDMTETLTGALKRVYNQTPETLERAWAAWVRSH